MTVSLGESAVTLSGPCGIDEVEVLVGYLESRPDLPVDVGAATMIHTALVQALMVFRPNITGSPMSSFIAQAILPGLKAYFHDVREPKGAELARA
jgi:hypothetical protein